MLAKNNKYYHVDKQKEVIFFDYVYYKGTSEHSFTFDYGKEIVKDSNLDLFLEKIKIIKPKELIIKKQVMSKGKDNFKEMQEILLQTLRDLKTGKIEIDKAKSISAVAQTLINSVKVEVTMNEGKLLE
jgi:hypothetical protein